jgi:S-formylglutathione hydrolase
MYFWFTDEHWEQRYGSPVSAEYWAANNTASLAVAHAKRIRESGVKIYLDCADEDYLQLHKGDEFLHRIMWDAGMKHEYHVFNGADHVGQTLKPSIQEALDFWVKL